MPEQGWKSITVSESTYDKLEALAKKEKRSISKQVEILLEVSA